MMTEGNNNWVNSTVALLDSLGENICKPYSIPMVPEELRKGSEKVHEPKVVSIGPRFKGRKELLLMEEKKLSCMGFLLERSRSHQPNGEIPEIIYSISHTVSFLKSAIRTSYAEQIQLDSFDFGTIIQDGCFLLELLISQSTEWKRLGPDSLGPSPATQLKNMEFILSDITLLENQIPFCLLPVLFLELFNSLFPSDFSYDNRKKMSARITTDLILSLFGNTHDLSSESIPYNSSASTSDSLDPSHILELVHSSFIRGENNQHIQQTSSVTKPIKRKRCATRLLAAGVTIVKSEDNSFIPKFSTGVLQIPHLCITQTMEARWRSFIAWELHTYKWNNSVGIDNFTFRALLFNDLICCGSDVQLLKNKGIIVDELGMSNRDLIYFFGSLTNGIDRGLVQSTYLNIALNTYPAAGSILRFPIILWHYLGRFSEWLTKFLKRGYNFAAALVTLFTVIQTCYAILSYHYPKK